MQTVAAEGLLQRRQRVFMPAMGTLYGGDALELVRGEGCHVWDREGRRYLDCLCGIAVTSLGHCHPEVVEAAARQLATFQHGTSLFLSELAVQLAEELLLKAPEGLAHVFFCADGSGAVDGAMVAARRATGRPRFLAFSEGLHGRTSLAMAVTGLPMWRSDPFPPGNVAHVPTPPEVSEAEVLARVEFAIQAAHGEFAAFVLEPVLGNGGILPLGVDFLRALHALLQRHGILLIVDEVQTGFCRTGHWFAIQQSGLRPDLLCVAKAMANGLPQAAWLCTDAVARAMTLPVASTFGGNPVAMAAALKVIEIMDREHLAERAARLGRQFLAGLDALALEFPALGRPRGRGLMLGVPTVGADYLDRLLLALRSHGIIAGKTGRHRDVLTFLPPLILSETQLAEALGGLRASLAEVAP